MAHDSGKKLKIFCDSSVLLAACLSETGASHQIFHHAGHQDWTLLVSPWVCREVRLNLPGQSPEAARRWAVLGLMTKVEADELTFDWPVMFERSKDKPVLFSALACADVLLTLDRRDFGELLGRTLYGLRVLTPGDFLRTEREAGRLRPMSPP